MTFMKRSNTLRKIYPAFSILCSWFLLWSCSEGPTPGPMSPIKLSEKPSTPAQTPQPSRTGTVRPVNRLAKREGLSLAKSGYNSALVVQLLEEVRDELDAIVANNPNSPGVSKLKSSIKEIGDALNTLSGNTDADDDDVEDDDADESNDKRVLKDINKAKIRIDDAVAKGDLLAAQGAQFKNQLAEIENQINLGFSPASDFRGLSKSLWIKKTHGGMIKFAGHSIAVPKYATKVDAEFSINISANDYITADFGPDGWFDKEVSVTISYKDADLTGIDPTKLTLAWYDESAGQWIDLGGVVDLVKKTVTAKAWHFTQYTLSTK